VDAQLLPSSKIPQLFAAMAQEYAAAKTSAERLEAILNGYPNRMSPVPAGYVEDNPTQSIKNFLSLGIKIGTDAGKSDTSAREFYRKAKRTQRLLLQERLNHVPYGKRTARRLHAGTFQSDDALASLKENPTLAAEIMENSFATGQRTWSPSRPS
jgi:hypothetical protein